MQSCVVSGSVPSEAPQHISFGKLNTGLLLVYFNRHESDKKTMTKRLAVQYFLANNGNGYAHEEAINSLVSTSANVSTYYDITFLPITDTTSSSFTITATPLTSSIQQNDGYLSITNTGLKTGTW